VHELLDDKKHLFQLVFYVWLVSESPHAKDVAVTRTVVNPMRDLEQLNQFDLLIPRLAVEGH